jgi:hypothetical protein
MARKVIEGGTQKIKTVNGSSYILIDAYMKKVMGIGEGDNIRLDLYWSDKHQDHYIAGYKVQICPACNQVNKNDRDVCDKCSECLKPNVHDDPDTQTTSE